MLESITHSILCTRSLFMAKNRDKEQIDTKLTTTLFFLEYVGKKPVEENVWKPHERVEVIQGEQRR